jgi:hypothetical protein
MDENSPLPGVEKHCRYFHGVSAATTLGEEGGGLNEGADD